MQIFGSRLKDPNTPLPIGYYLTGNRDAKVESVSKIDGMTVFEAAEKGSLATVTTFLLGGVDPNVQERDGSRATPLHYAAKGGDQLVLRFLIDNGARIDATNASGESPLMWAVQANHPDVVLALLDKGANMNHADDAGRCVAYFGASSPTALHCLVKRGVSVKTLLFDEKKTLLHVAVQQVAQSRHSSAWASVLYLCETGGIDVNAQDATGRTALHYTCAARDLNGVKALCLKGASCSIRDAGGALPGDLAKGSPQIKSFLSAFVAEKSSSKQQKLCQPDHSNYGNLDQAQLKPFLVAFFVPNTIVAMGSYLPTWIGLWTLIVFAVGFTVVARYSMGQKKRSLATAGWYSGALFFGCGILFTKVFPVYAKCHENHLALYIWWASTVPMFYCYVRAVLADPGVVQSTVEGRQEIYDTIAVGGENEVKRQGFDMVSLVKKPLRAKHCSKTGQCVSRFDHFCVWTGNAIGGGNHRYFVWYCFLQTVAQLMVEHICYSYMFTCTPKYLPPDVPPPSGFLAWVEWTVKDPDHRMVTFFMFFYNTFAFLFVSTVIIVQMWYATRNVTSNEVWFTDRYRWMFRLGSRSFSMYDVGFWGNVKDFFWSGDLCQVSYAVPTMNPHLTKISKRYAQQLKARQEASGPSGGRAAVDSALEAGQYGSHGHSHGEEEHGYGGDAPPMMPNSNFDYAGAFTALPQDKQQELVTVQAMLQQLIQGQPITQPAGLDPESFDRLTQQARTMYANYTSAMASLQGSHASVATAGEPPATPPPAVSSANASSGGNTAVQRRKAD